MNYSSFPKNEYIVHYNYFLNIPEGIIKLGEFDADIFSRCVARHISPLCIYDNVIPTCLPAYLADNDEQQTALL